MAQIHISKDPSEQAAVAFTHDPLLKIKIKNDMIYEKLGEWLHGHRPLTGCGKTFFTGCSKRSRYKAPEILRNEAYIEVRRNDEG